MSNQGTVTIVVKTYPISRSGYSQVTPQFVECQHEDKVYHHNYRSSTKTAYCKAKRILYVPEFVVDQKVEIPTLGDLEKVLNGTGN
jgi:hypothetical protein